MRSTCEISELVVIAVHEAGSVPLCVTAGGTTQPQLLDEELQRGTAKWASGTRGSTTRQHIATRKVSDNTFPPIQPVSLRLFTAKTLVTMEISPGKSATPSGPVHTHVY